MGHAGSILYPVWQYLAASKAARQERQKQEHEAIARQYLPAANAFVNEFCVALLADERQLTHLEPTQDQHDILMKFCASMGCTPHLRGIADDYSSMIIDYVAHAPFHPVAVEAVSRSRSTAVASLQWGLEQEYPLTMKIGAHDTERPLNFLLLRRRPADREHLDSLLLTPLPRDAEVEIVPPGQTISVTTVEQERFMQAYRTVEYHHLGECEESGTHIYGNNPLHTNTTYRFPPPSGGKLARILPAWLHA